MKYRIDDMIKTLKHLSLLLFIPLLAMACREDKEDAALTEEEPVNLTVSLKVPRIELSRGVSDDPRNEDGTWNEWEELVDGRKLYHVTLFLIEKTTQRLVGIRDIEHGSDHITVATNAYGANGFSKNGVVDPNLKTAEEVVFTFNYDHPRHGDCEKLRRGEFLLLVVANHTDRSQTIGSTTYTYAGLKNSNGTTLESLVESIKTTFDVKNGKGIDNFTQENTSYADFFDFPVIANDDYLCDKNAPQPLSLVQNIALNPGDNHVSGELKRTYSRVRIEVMNNSGTNPLKIKDFSFSENFAQKQTYLFVHPDNADRQFTSGFSKAAPKVASLTAITPYSDEASVAIGTRQVLFDGYILESQAGAYANYTYSLDLWYEGENYIKEEYVVSDESYSDISSLKSFFSANPDDYFLIKNMRRESQYGQNRYIYVENDQLLQGNSYMNAELINRNALWQLEAFDAGKNQYYIYNVGATSYVGAAPGSGSKFPTIIQNKVYFTFSDNTGSWGGIQMSASSVADGVGDSYSYMNDNNGSFICSYLGNDGGNGFKFIPVSLDNTEVPARYEGEVVLETIDPVTAYVSPVSSIQRNDFIDVLITMTYNKNNEKGHFLFEVIPWKTGGGEIEFN